MAGKTQKPKSGKKKKGKTGRPTKLTPGVVEVICDVVAEGMTVEDGAILAGITPRTVSTWMSRGRSSTRGRYRDFLLAVTRARANGERDLIHLVRTERHYRGPLAILERRWPDKWGPKTPEERRKLAAEADLAEAKAALARAAREKLTGDLVVMLGDGEGEIDLTGSLTDEELAELIVTQLGES